MADDHQAVIAEAALAHAARLRWLGYPEQVRQAERIEKDVAALASLVQQLRQCELCAICTPERDHNGVLCRRHANEQIGSLVQQLQDAETALRKAERQLSNAPVLDAYSAGAFQTLRAALDSSDGRETEPTE